MSIFPKFHKNWGNIVEFLLRHSDFRIAFLIKLRLYTIEQEKRRVEIIDRPFLDTHLKVLLLSYMWDELFNVYLKIGGQGLGYG